MEILSTENFNTPNAADQNRLTDPSLSSKSNSAKKNFEIVDNYTTDLLNNSKEPTNTEQKFYVKDKFEKAEKRGGKKKLHNTSQQLTDGLKSPENKRRHQTTQFVAPHITHLKTKSIDIESSEQENASSEN